jgi:phosphate-selective porin
MKSLWSAVVALGMAGAAFADDQDGTLPLSLGDDAAMARFEAETLLREVELLQQSDEEAIRKLREQAAKESQDELKDLPRRVSAVEKNMAAAGQTWDASKMLSFATPDGNFTAKIGGRIYLNYRHVDNAPSTGPNLDTFYLDTGRVMVEGSFFKNFVYRIEVEGQSSAGGAIATKEIFVGLKIGDFLFRGGQMKVPWSAEETCSSRFIDFVERSILNRLTPGFSQGVMATMTLFEKMLELNLGVFNGSLTREQGTRSLEALGDAKEIAGRIYAFPFMNMGSPILKVLRLGVDATLDFFDNEAMPDVNPGDLRSGGLTFMDFTALTAVDGMRTRVLFSLAWVYGPASVRAELGMYFTELDLALTGGVDDFRILMYLVQGSYLLTGEAKQLDNRIKPDQNLDPLAGGWGAWELAVRFTGIQVDRNAITSGMMAAGANLKTIQLTFGVNWWWAPNVVMRFNWEMLNADAAIFPKATGGSNDRLNVFLIRWQIDF